MTQLERLNIKLGKTADADTLAILLEDAISDFLTLTGRDNVPAAASGLVEDMAVYKYNQLENKGLSSQSYSGISESYSTDYDNTLKSSINRYRKLRLL